MRSASKYFISLSYCGQSAFSDPVHEIRKFYRSVVAVIVQNKKRSFVNRVVTDNTASVAKLFDAWRQIQRKDFCSEAIAFCSERNHQPFKSKTQHGASTLRRSADHFLGFIKSFSGFIWEVFRRLHCRGFRPNQFLMYPHGWLIAGCANAYAELLGFIKPKRFRAKTEISISIESAKARNLARYFSIVGDFSKHHLCFYSAMGANK